MELSMWDLSWWITLVCFISRVMSILRRFSTLSHVLTGWECRQKSLTHKGNRNLFSKLNRMESLQVNLWRLRMEQALKIMIPSKHSVLRWVQTIWFLCSTWVWWNKSNVYFLRRFKSIAKSFKPTSTLLTPTFEWLMCTLSKGTSTNQ